MTKDKRSAARVNFDRHNAAVRMMAINGSWQRECEMLDVSQTGVLLRVRGKVAIEDVKEFFLVLSSNGHAHRRCELAWIDGDRIGASFVVEARKKHPLARH